MRPLALLVAIAPLVGAPALAQSTARPLPTAGLASPLHQLQLAAPSLSASPAQPARAGISEASAPLVPPVTEGDAWKPTSTRGVEDFSSLELFAQARGSARFQDTSGSLEVQRGGLDAIFGRRTPGERAWALHLSSESSFYSFGKSSTLVPGEARPFNDLYQTSAGLQLAAAAGPKLSWLAGFEVTMAGEDLADPSDALVAGGLGGVRYAITPDVDFSFGLAGESQLEDDAWVMPFFGMDWRIADGTSFAIQGSEMRFEQRLGAHLSGHLGALFDVRQYRLNDANPVPSGVFRDEEIRVTAGLDWKFAETGRLGIEFGQVLWNELTVLDSGGGLVGSSEAEKAPFVGFSLRFGM